MNTRRVRSLGVQEIAPRPPPPSLLLVISSLSAWSSERSTKSNYETSKRSFSEDEKNLETKPSNLSDENVGHGRSSKQQALDSLSKE